MANAKLSQQDRSSRGMLLKAQIEAGLRSKGSIESWWRVCEENHRNQMRWDSAPDASPAASGTQPKLSPMHVPFAQPRQDMLTAQMCSIITKQEPYMLADDIGDEAQERRKEEILHRFWRAAGFEDSLREASYICTDTNIVQWRVAFEANPSKPFGGLIMDVVPPKDFFLFPATRTGIRGARSMGHRFYRRMKEVKLLQKKGVYFNADLVGGDHPKEYDKSGKEAFAGTSLSNVSPDPGDERVELWDCLIKYSEDGKPEQWYRATIAFKSGILLSWEPYPYTRPWYFDTKIITEVNDGYWPAVSLARHLSLLQDATDKLYAAAYNGSMAMAMPNTYTSEDLPDKDTRAAWGELITGVNSPSQIYSGSQNTFRADPLVKIIEMLAEEGDKTARISANTQGAVQARETTATENSIIAAGVATGVEEYLQNFTRELPNMAEFTCELLATHFSEWWPMWGPCLGIQEPSELTTPCSWVVNGKTPGSTPGAKLAFMDKLMALAESPLGAMAGLDPYEIVSAMIANSGLAGTKNIQIARERMAAMQQQAAAQQQMMAGGEGGQPGGQEPGTDTAGLSGMEGPQGGPAQPGGPPAPEPANY